MNFTGSLRLVDDLQKQPKGTEILLGDKHQRRLVLARRCEKHEAADITAVQKNITFINFTFSRMFFSFQTQQAEISHSQQAESAKFLIHFYSRKVILESSEGGKKYSGS